MSFLTLRDPTLSSQLAKDFNNLMLLCPPHHKLVDDNPTEYPVELLQEYKWEHEQRIEHLTSIDQSMRTHRVFFRNNIGSRAVSITYGEARTAVLPRYPAEPRAIEINLAYSPYRDHEPSYFLDKQEEISWLVDARLRQRTIDEAIAYLSIFALASIPLLIHLGYEIGEVIPSEIYQGHRDTKSWAWQPPSGQDPRYIIDAPEDPNASDTKAVVLNLSLSGVIQPQEIDRVMTVPYCTYTVTIPKPHRDYLKSREQLELFAAEMRVLLRQIREVHGTDGAIHLLPAIPAAVALKPGQLLLPKVDPPIHIYDHHQLNGGFGYALTIPRREAA